MRRPSLLSLKHHRMTPIFFALFTEFLILTLFGFIVLLSIEILLPTFVSARINLSLIFGGILSLFILHHTLSIWLSRSIHPPKKWIIRSLIVISGLWGLILVFLSLLKFPIPAAAIIISLCILLGYFFRKIYFTL